MMKVIDDRYDAEGKPYLVFKVYQEPDNETVYGYLISQSEYDAEGLLNFVKTDVGVPVAPAFIDALKKADAFGQDFDFHYLWVQDLDNLFPPEKRPDITHIFAGDPLKQAS